MLSATRVVDIVGSRLAESIEPLHVYWYRVTEPSRRDFAKAIENARAELAILPIVVRQNVFSDPNALLSDMNSLLSEQRVECEGIQVKAGRPIALVLLARSDLRLAQTGSHVTLPHWFPNLGGQEVFVRIRDLCFDVDTVAFNDPEGRTDDLAARTLQLEAALASRLRSIFAVEPARLDSFWGVLADHLVLGKSRDVLRQVLQAHRAHVDTIAEPRGYRPTLKATGSLLSQLVGAVQRSNVEALVTLAKALARALDLPGDVSLRQPLIAILLRPTQPMDKPVRFAHTILAIAYGSYQFLNASAHASEYPAVSVAFLYLNSKDLRAALQEGTRALECLPCSSGNISPGDGGGIPG